MQSGKSIDVHVSETEAESWNSTKWVLRFVWEPRDEDSMLGTLQGGLLVHGPKAAQVRERLIALLRERLQLGAIRTQQVEMPLALLPISRPSRESAEKLPVYDIFVSYSTLDNGDQWVTEFVKSLSKSVNQHLGEWNSNRVWWDEHRIESMEPLTPQIQDRVSRSRLLLILLSPGSVQSKWCQLERQYFFEKYPNAMAEKRILLVDLGLLEREKRPQVFHDLKSEGFFEKKESKAATGKPFGYPKPDKDSPSHQPFFDAIHRLGEILAQRLKADS